MQLCLFPAWLVKRIDRVPRASHWGQKQRSLVNCLRMHSDPIKKSARQHLKPELADFKSLQWSFVYHLVASMILHIFIAKQSHAEWYMHT